VSNTPEKMPLIKNAAEEIIKTFESVSGEALKLLKAPPVQGQNVFATMNTLTLGSAFDKHEDRMQQLRESLRILSREPAIARVLVEDQQGIESTIYVCRTTPISNSSDYASNYSPLGRLAALPTGYELKVGARTLRILEKEKLRPILLDKEWDSDNTEFEALGIRVFTVESLRPFLDVAALIEDLPDLLNQILADEKIKEGIIDGRRHSLITKMSLRDQPILDQYQDEIFRLPLRERLFILGPAGTGKTTTLIRRLGQKLNPEGLEEDEKDLVQTLSAAGAPPHRESWLMFTPTELLKQYLKEAFAKEGVPASDQRITTWHDFSHELARNVFNVLRSTNTRSGFVQKPSSPYLTKEAQVSSFSLFQEFSAWQMDSYVNGLKDAAARMTKSANQTIAFLGQKLLSTNSDGEKHLSIATVMSSIYSLSAQISSIMDELKSQTDAILDQALNQELRRDRDFLTKLGQFVSDLRSPDAEDVEEDDESDGEEDDTQLQYAGILAAMATYRRAMRALARASASGRALRAASRNGQIISWFGERVLSQEETLKAGESFLLQDAVRQFSNPVRRYTRGIPLRYRRFRRTRDNNSKWYTGAIPTNDIGLLELDVVLLTILRTGAEMLSLTSISGNIADPFWASLQSVNDLFKNQVLIDEVADFASVQLGCMSALAHPRIRSVFACGDFNQRVTSWGTRSLDEVRMVIPDVDVRRITTTYRQSRRLNELAKAIVEAFGGSGDIAIVPADIDFDGVSPALIEKCSEQKQIVAWIADRIREIERELRKLPSIAIFVRQDDDIQPLAEDLNRALEDSNILVEACRDGKVVGQETAVRIFAVEYIKGLEFESVFFVGVDQLMETYPDLYDKYLYVGATRAATYLGFTCEKKLPEPLSRLRSIFVEMWT
jgi:superfamily I DNA/RNA helicase